MHTIITHLPDLKEIVRLLNSSATVLDFWNMLFDNDITQNIVEYTNTKITNLGVLYGSNLSYVNYTNDIEIKALIGLLYLCDVYKSGHEDAVGLWKSDGTGRNIFRATMSYKRFIFLLAALQFYNPVEKIIKKSNDDELAYISEIFLFLLVNFHSNYTHSKYMTADKMIVVFRG